MTPTEDTEQTTTFEALGLRPELLEALTALGYEEPTGIQTEAIPPLLEGRDLLGQAATGTGKTAAFALPLLQRWAEERGGGGESGGRSGSGPAGLILVPTRELAVQVAEAVHRYGRGFGARVLPIYGGQPIGRQRAALQRGVDVVVATPGRALDHMRRRTLDLDSVRVVVLDEGDEMLDMGFTEDIETILATTPEDRQTVLFSATLPARINAIVRRHLRDPIRIEIARGPLAQGETPLVRQTAYIIPQAQKTVALGRILDVEAPEAAIVFCRTRNEVDQLSETLAARGYRAEPIHGGMTQEQRDRVMGRLRGGTAELLVATDVAARGLDIERLTHVINYDVPSAPEAYVHRIGRVGRAGREGVAITLATPREHGFLKNIERLTRRRIPIEKVPTVADLRARRLELTRAALRETLLEDDLDHVRVVVEALSDEFDLMDIAAAAVKLAHAAEAGEDQDDEVIRDVPPPETRAAATGKAGKAAMARGRKDRGRPDGGPTSRIFISAGRKAGVRPQDIVGAIANEAGINAREIGSIEIADRFSFVELNESDIPQVLDALRSSTIKGRKVKVSRER